VLQKEIEDEATANMISKATLRRAKDDLKIESKKDGMAGGWVWYLQSETPNARYGDKD
jgi:hypothetical protein